MSDEKARSLNDAMQTAVQTATSEVWPGDMVTRFITILETLDGTDGSRALLIATTPEMKTWDALGLLHYSLQQEQATAVADRFESEDE